MSSNSRDDSLFGACGSFRHMSDFDFSETRIEILVRCRAPCRMIEVVQYSSHHNKPFEGFLERMENVDEGIVNNALHSDVVVLDNEE